ncbi:YitT family protein [Anaerobacillus alkaliphilus]|uniref:YitT family protein n=1 Tax=Anaerobacillus alkaliphilus TaxID=1548597 RepID=A0A4Q0VNS9_9BACI|nr:YitT family protein [Anaerobacillus alkaliphilus]RXI97828.1 YitT family protein [Anaerobacillus alkaliphilus]
MGKKFILVLFGLFLTALGIKLLTINMLTFGGTAGIATILTYIIPLSWGALFFIVNLPFFLISFQQLGRWFTLSSFMSIIGISIMRDSLDLLVPSIQMDPIVAAIIAGIFIGIGVSFVLNNGSSLGGIHILALYLDKRFGINRGLCILIGDSLIIIAAAFLVGWHSAIVSIISIVIASYIIGRYKSIETTRVVTEDTSVLQDAANS